MVLFCSSDAVPKSSVGRSNSAPQAQNRFTSGRQGMKSKVGLSSKLPTSPKKHSRVEASNIPTLSDGVIYMNHEQAAQAAAIVLSSHDQTRGHLSENNPSNTGMLKSSTPLCDANHSSSSLEYYAKAQLSLGQGPKPGDVWQRRKKFGRSESVDSYNSVNMPGYLHPESRNCAKTEAPYQKFAGLNTLEGYTKDHMTHGSGVGMNGSESHTDDMEEDQSLRYSVAYLILFSSLLIDQNFIRKTMQCL